MSVTSYKIERYEIRLYAVDRKGERTRWGDKVIYLFSEGSKVGQAVFSEDNSKVSEPYMSSGIIYYFASNSQYEAVIDLLRNESPVYITWEPVSDPKEPQDGDAYFHF